MRFQLAALFLCSVAYAQMEKSNSFSIEFMHMEAVSWFVGRPGFGMSRVKPVNEVYFGTLPLLDRKVNFMEETFAVKEMQLIGIAKHDPPVAFLLEDSTASSPHRPAGKDRGVPMSNMQDYKTRSLTEDEKRAIETLKADATQEVVVTGRVLSLGPAPIVAVGPIRAGRSCLDCHDAKEGELLGAFSYTLEPVPNPRVPAEALPKSMKSKDGR